VTDRTAGDRTGLRFLPSPPGAEAYPALFKPAGRVVHGADGLLEEARKSLGPAVALAHRLDRETSGVLLLTRDPEALAAAHRAWGEQVTKTYLARTRGVPFPAEGLIDAPLLENRSGRPDLLKRALVAAYGPARAGHLLSGRGVNLIPRIPAKGTTAVHPAGRPAQTRYRVLADEGTTALVELTPVQGRMHQIRVHLKHLGTPILGDRLYDEPGDEVVLDPPFLHALRLVWRDPPGRPEGDVWTWEAPAGMIGK
jgi:23S rRNA pseudouridine955/2504/2580 synthase